MDASTSGAGDILTSTVSDPKPTESPSSQKLAENECPSLGTPAQPQTTKPKNELESPLQDIVNFVQDTTLSFQNLQIQSSYPNDKKDSAKYTPGALRGGGINLQEIQQHLEQVLLQTGEDQENDQMHSVPFRQLDDIGKMTVTSHAMASYMSALDIRHMRKVANRLVSDTSLWISRLCRFYDSSSYFHEDGREGLVRVCRMVLYSKYPKLPIDGYEALYTRPPVIYISAAYRPGLGHFICSQLGLPLACLTTVPCSDELGSQNRMDVEALEKLLKEDTNASRIPLVLLGNIGTALMGQVDNLSKLQELCKTYNVWLHVEGHSLSALSLVSIPNLPARIGDSMTLPFGLWLGIPSLPFVTLYKTVEGALIHAAGLTACSPHARLSCLPLWVAFQGLGNDGITQRIKHCFELSECMLERLEATTQTRILGKQRLKSKEGVTYTVNDVLNKSVSTLLLFDILVSTVVFQYVGEQSNAEGGEAQDPRPFQNPPYFDNLNSWLGQVLLRDVPTVQIDILHSEHNGICLRFCPLETAHVTSTTKQDIDDFCNSLQQQVSILNSTVRQKEVFYRLVGKFNNMKIVEIANWAGLGGVRFISQFWVGRENELTDNGKEEINKLNASLVVKLKSLDSAFSLGEGDDGMLCVRFGMVTDDLDVDELVNMVHNGGQEIEESELFLETMAEMVKQGITEANKGLQIENQEKLMTEGVLKHVPIVGSFVNWWYPSDKEAGIKGRSFNLTSGVVESTENIYKYHMQIQHGATTSANTPPPATKAVIVPKKSPIHSRTSSASSEPPSDAAQKSNPGLN